MKSVLFGWLLGLGLMASHIGCCSIRMAGHGCETGSCGSIGCSECGESGRCGTLRSKIANRIRSTNCGSGCGEVYWDEQINEPPVCDPCGCDGQFECGSCNSCPSVLRRLRSLWGYRYQPSNCEECSSCSTGSTSSGSCSTCASNTHAEPNNAMFSDSSVRTSTPMELHQPMPATKPRAIRDGSTAPEPIPDSNANYQRPQVTRERIAIGSGVSNTGKSTIARPVSSNASQSVKGKPRLVTNPR